LIEPTPLQREADAAGECVSSSLRNAKAAVKRRPPTCSHRFNYGFGTARRFSLSPTNAVNGEWSIVNGTLLSYISSNKIHSPFTIHDLPLFLRRRRCRRWSSHLRRLFGFLGLGSGMAFEHSRRRKLTQFVPDHVLRNVDWNMPLAVMHAKRQSHHVRRDRRTSRPGTNHLRSLRAGANALDCLPNTFVHPGTFFN